MFKRTCSPALLPAALSAGTQGTAAGGDADHMQTAPAGQIEWMLIAKLENNKSFNRDFGSAKVKERAEGRQ
jgi:hypothetical protein